MKKYLLTALLACSMYLAFAQVNNAVEDKYQPVENPRIGFAIQPQTLFMNGLRVDVQPYLKPQHQLVIAPQVYYSGNSSWLWYADANVELKEMKGLGLELHYRVFPKAGKPLYGAFGVGYNFFQVSYPTNTYFATNENGLPTYEFGEVNNRQNINRLGVSVMMGWQLPTLYGFFFDLYWGVGFRYGFVNKRYDDNVSFGNGMWSIAQRGTCLLLGVKIGFEV